MSKEKYYADQEAATEVNEFTTLSEDAECGGTDHEFIEVWKTYPFDPPRKEWRCRYCGAHATSTLDSSQD